MTPRRARVYKTECMVLARRAVGEADNILTVFSIDRGRFDAVARGVRKLKSRMGGHLEPLTRARVLIAQGRSLDVFSQAETVAVYRHILRDLDSYAAATHAAELVRRVAPEREPLPDLYKLLVALLEELDAGARHSVLRAFEMRLLEGAGFGIQVGGCAGCGSEIPEEASFFSPGAGGILCSGCRGSGEAGRLLSVRALKVLRFATRASFAEFAAVRMDQELEHEVGVAVTDALSFALDAETRSSRFMTQLDSLRRRLGDSNGEPASGDRGPRMPGG